MKCSLIFAAVYIAIIAPGCKVVFGFILMSGNSGVPTSSQGAKSAVHSGSSMASHNSITHNQFMALPKHHHGHHSHHHTGSSKSTNQTTHGLHTIAGHQTSTAAIAKPGTRETKAKTDAIAMQMMQFWNSIVPAPMTNYRIPHERTQSDIHGHPVRQSSKNATVEYIHGSTGTPISGGVDQGNSSSTRLYPVEALAKAKNPFLNEDLATNVTYSKEAPSKNKPASNANEKVASSNKVIPLTPEAGNSRKTDVKLSTGGQPAQHLYKQAPAAPLPPSSPAFSSPTEPVLGRMQHTLDTTMDWRPPLAMAATQTLQDNWNWNWNSPLFGLNLLDPLINSMVVSPWLLDGDDYYGDD